MSPKLLELKNTVDGIRLGDAVTPVDFFDSVLNYLESLENQVNELNKKGNDNV